MDYTIGESEDLMARIDEKIENMQAVIAGLTDRRDAIEGHLMYLQDCQEWEAHLVQKLEELGDCDDEESEQERDELQSQLEFIREKTGGE